MKGRSCMFIVTGKYIFLNRTNESYMGENYTTKIYDLFIFFFTPFLTLILFSSSAFGQVVVPFSQRTSKHSMDRKIYNIRGDFTMLGNTNLTLENYGDHLNNSFNQMKYVDVDNDPNTLNSSSATLQLSEENGANPECSNILFAGLYWTGRSVPGNEPFQVTGVSSGSTSPVSLILDKRKAQIKGPNQTEYTTLTAAEESIYFPQAGLQNDMYVAYVEITDFVRTHGLGEYTVANLAIEEKLSDEAGYYGGWSMVVIYENSQMNWRDVTTFDGFAFVEMNIVEDFELPISGFKAIQQGPVDVKLGIMVGEGDVEDAGDFLQIRNHGDTDWISLSHEKNEEFNFFNSSIYTGDSLRNPFLKNNTGIDISVFPIPNPNNEVIGNGQTETKFRYGSAIDTYVIYNMTFAVNAYVPGIEPNNTVKKINGEGVEGSEYSIQPGQEIEYELQIRNSGTEAIEDLKIVIPLPKHALFVHTDLVSAQPNFQGIAPVFDSNIGSNGAIVWDFGNLPLEGNEVPFATLRYTLKLTDECAQLTDTELENFLIVNGKVNGMGTTSKTGIVDQGFIFGYNASGACMGEPILKPTEVRIDADSFLENACKIPPVAFDDHLVSKDGASVNINLLTNDTPGSTAILPAKTRLIHPESKEETTGLHLPGKGVFELLESGEVVFTPTEGYSGEVSVEYVIYDTNGLHANAWVFVQVFYTPPEAIDDFIASSTGGPVEINILDNDLPGSTALLPEKTRFFLPGTTTETLEVDFPGEGKYVLGLDGLVTLIPVPGFVGEHRIEYIVYDVNNKAATATILSQISYLLPVAEDDFMEGDGSPIEIPVLDNDKQGTEDLDPATVRLVDPVSGDPLHQLTLPGQGRLEVNSDGRILFIPEKGFEGEVVFYYTVKDKLGVVSNPAQVKVVITLPEDERIRIPNVFTPNGDGRNDTFVIDYKGSEGLDLTIFNRWGAEVYRNTNYQNNWDGGLLNEGTYYYLVVFKKEGVKHQKKGWVLLKR